MNAEVTALIRSGGAVCSATTPDADEPCAGLTNTRRSPASSIRDRSAA